MIIKYELEKDTTISETPCPHGRKGHYTGEPVKVYSLTCQDCDFFIDSDEEDQTIACRIEKTS